MMEQAYQKIYAFLDENRNNMIADLCELIAYNSVRGEALPGKPFGDAPAAALAKTEEICRRMGLAAENHENYALSAKLNEKPVKLDILAHLDIVEAGDGWDTDPFKGVIKDGKIFGRGSSDDKGPAVAAIYAAAAVKKFCPELSGNCRLVLGSSEETGSEDIKHFYATHKNAPMSFSPDAEYPVINIEKGAYGPKFSAEWESDVCCACEACIAGMRVLKLAGGKTNNIVPKTAWAQILIPVQGEILIELLTIACEKTGKATGAVFDIRRESSEVYRVTVTGEGAHASMPERGNNAQTALIKMLASLPLADCRSTRAIKAFNALFPHGDTSGKALGIEQKDDISGALTLNFGVLDLGENGFTARFDSRVPICATEETVSKPVAKKLAALGFTVDTLQMKAAHHTPADSELVKTLIRVYEQHTGKKGECLAIGGGTYVHDIEGGVAFGCEMPGADYHIHGPNEYAIIDELIKSAKMFAQAIFELCV
ncbi:MAG TPA: Sapep family Mn(2+)-dependent dipeptidase [Oscillospiraceae bacterium]|nr:Sapep family Mn(2+)-dependent dipeptidase [Oscillospiraceae bacterium]HPS34892.1 Sapep family Mn(2+)-dependent dipeptidase [Oscillospiraceae bacterium]